jgi:hypothetical protein
MGLPKFTIAQWMFAVAALGLVLSMPPIMVPLVILFLLAVSYAVIYHLPSRFRLATGIVILLVFLVLAASERESGFYAGQAHRTSELARQASGWAAAANSPKERAILLRESAWFGRRSRTLRWRAIWKGVLHRPAYPAGNREELIRVVDLMWEIQRHEDTAREAVQGR